jgi:hypothetical protein
LKGVKKNEPAPSGRPDVLVLVLVPLVLVLVLGTLGGRCGGGLGV